MKKKEFTEEYKELIDAFIGLRREMHAQMLIVEEITLPIYWKVKYPNLLQDLTNNGLEKLLGFKIKNLSPYIELNPTP